VSNRVTARCTRSIVKFAVAVRSVGAHTAKERRGYKTAHKIDMLNFSAANLIAGFVFGSIGFIAFFYGKRMNLWKPMLLGIALMGYPYFVRDDKLMVVIGIFGSFALFFLRE
jgi:hypothetical protein